MNPVSLASALPQLVGEDGITAILGIVPEPADGVFTLTWLLIALPLLGAFLLLAVAPFVSGALDRIGHLIGVACVAASFVVGAVLFLALLGRDEGERQIAQHLWTWIPVDGFNVGMDLMVDQLSILFVLLITGVGSLIHVYSIGYMAHDERRRRFFGYLNLFVAAMLTLVLAGNYVVLFLGWEGVGVASYLLIGFWQRKPSAAAAAKKAFVMNRIGDIGLALAIAMMFAHFGSSDFSRVTTGVVGADEKTATIIGLLLLLAACGKSAQVPLQSWLLDAMEGPTPVSALIHAATMVTAGVYLVVRSNAIFESAPAAQTAVLVVAVVTMLVGAVISCAKDDIKKVLAGSTMSQIGYMMLACGLGPIGYPLAIFHLLTHGFFKANMFLGAGSVMHGMNDDVDMRHYGALRKFMPVTFLTFAMGYLAIIGFPGFSGFWSKDKIIESALADNLLVGLLALLGAGITGFYMTRLMLMTFFTGKRWEPDVHPHESPKVMTVPLMVLAALSVLGGVLLLGDWIVDWLAPVTGHGEHHELAVPAIVITAAIVAVVAIGVGLAWFLVGARPVPSTAPADVSPFTRLARADLGGDVINQTLVVTPTAALVRATTAGDTLLVDGTVEGVAASANALSRMSQALQNGYVRSYALSILGGALLVVLALLAVTFA